MEFLETDTLGQERYIIQVSVLSMDVAKARVIINLTVYSVL